MHEVLAITGKFGYAQFLGSFDKIRLNADFFKLRQFAPVPFAQADDE